MVEKCLGVQKCIFADILAGITASVRDAKEMVMDEASVTNERILFLFDASALGNADAN
ncbi:MAG: hypothetical protein ACE5KJ_01125 [Candidatus Zixiibacteriota bacterium]